MNEQDAATGQQASEAGSTAFESPVAYRVDDDNNLEEKDLTRTYLFGKSEDKSPDQPGYEGEGMGGRRFGENNVTPAGDDKANPSQNAGYANAYFKRTEPSEEHPENTNFKDPAQGGAPNYAQAQPRAEDGDKEQDDEPHENADENKYQEGTTDNDGKNDEEVNIPGPGELPDQQKVGEDNASEPGTANYKPEYDEGRPDYGSHSPENEEHHIET